MKEVETGLSELFVCPLGDEFPKEGLRLAITLRSCFYLGLHSVYVAFDLKDHATKAITVFLY